ncbi:hypothetical protein RB596_002249 [Gaeumannomyces avenae]
MSRNTDPRAVPLRQHKIGPNRGSTAGPGQDVLFSPPPSEPPSPRPWYTGHSSTSSEYGTHTPASSDCQDEGVADLETDPEPCHGPATPTNESPRGSSDGQDTPGGGDTARPGSDAATSKPSGDGTTTTTTTPYGRPSELEYQEKYGPQIEAWLSDLERRAARNTNVFLNDGVTPNPARAPYVSLGGGGAAGRGSWGSDGPEPFWRWSVLLQRWIHEDPATGMLLIYPKQLIH